MSKNYVTRYRGEVYFTPSGKLHVKDEPVTPIEEDFGDHYNLDYLNDNYAMRKSMSMNDIATLKEEFIKEEEIHNKDDMYSRHRKHSEVNMLSKTKFVSMAEAIYHYQRDTPERFHSTKQRIFRPQSHSGHSGLTVPQSPMLRCKARSRPQHILSQKEKEEMEIEEIKKFKIKANPIPKCVFEGSKNLPEVPKKPATIPEPFKLTEISKKITQLNSPGQVHNFKARPAPKHILEKPHIPIKLLPPVTKPVTPKFPYKRSNSADHLKQHVKNNQPTDAKKLERCEKTIRHGPVKAEPFSFQKRDEELKKRREERIKQQMEEERRLATQFKAQPLPAAVKKRMHSAIPSHPSESSSENKENQNVIKFEAKPPIVLYKEPFKPILQQAHTIKPIPFDLTTSKRAVEREIFDKQLKEKEEENDRLRLQKEREQREAEEKAVAQLRAKLVHHAKPVPPLHPFVPEKSTVFTMPETPKFIRRMKQQ